MVAGAVGGGVDDAVGATVGVGVGVGCGGVFRPSAIGAGWANQSVALSFESVALPRSPPGRRSMLDEAGGATAALPSTHAFVASPQPTASITVPPVVRSTSAPPVAAIPLLHVASATDAKTPAALAARSR